MILYKEQKALFDKLIENAICDINIPIQNEIEFGRVYKCVHYKYENRGCRDLRFRILNSKGDKFIFEYYLLTDDYSSHKRIKNDGQIVDLENYEGQFGWPIFENKEDTEKEHNRIRSHNQKVQKILKVKGFED